MYSSIMKENYLGYNEDGFKNYKAEQNNELYVHSGTRIGGSMTISGDITMQKDQKIILNRW